MIAYPDIPGIALYPIIPEFAPSLDFDIIDQPPLQRAAPTLDILWKLEQDANPRLFDGPILLVDPNDLRSDLPRLRRSSYKFHVCNISDSLRSLGVQALLLGSDAAGLPHLLLGRRSSEVRAYPGLWENAPSGGVPPPTGSSIGQSHFIKALVDEGLEELGITLNAANTTFLTLLEDSHARSLDVVLRIELPDTINPRATPCPVHERGRWEYAAAAWVPIPLLREWATQHAHAISPPTLAVLRWMGWT